jgi:hypothetical protein
LKAQTIKKNKNKKQLFCELFVYFYLLGKIGIGEKQPSGILTFRDFRGGRFKLGVLRMGELKSRELSYTPVIYK